MLASWMLIWYGVPHEGVMERILFRYRSQHLDKEAIAFIRGVIARHYEKGRSYIARAICEAWSWRQPNGKLKEYPARDMLLRLEERGLICLPPRLYSKNNAVVRTYDQVPLFTDTALHRFRFRLPLPSFHLSQPVVVTGGITWFIITIIWGIPGWLVSI